MKILTIEDSEVLAEVYNRQVAGITPLCPVATSEEFVHDCSLESDFAINQGFHDPCIIAAELAGKIEGFAHVVGKADKQVGLIRFLTYRPGDWTIGKALLLESLSYLRGLGYDRIQGFFPKAYRFYHFGIPSLSYHTAHVYALFGANGFQPAKGWRFMLRPLRSIRGFSEDTPSGYKVLVERIPGAGNYPNLRVSLSQNDQEVGWIHCRSAQEFASSAPHDHIQFSSVRVVEDHRNRGLGVWLGQRAFIELAETGYSEVSVVTGDDNYRAQLLYSRLGFSTIDTTNSFYNYNRE